MKPLLLLIILSALMLSAACSTTQRFHDSTDDPGVISWERRVSNQNLVIDMQWAKPMKPGPHSTLIIHPGIREKASDLKALTIDLARHGYLAVAVSYQRIVNGTIEDTPFTLRDISDINFVLETIKQNPLVDRSNIGTIGFSLGGANSMLLAAHSADIKAVATFYPMTDFIDWLDNHEKPFIWQLSILLMKSKIDKELPDTNLTTRRLFVANYSPINYANQLKMPILIFHGAEDKITPLSHSYNMVSKLRAFGNQDIDFKVVQRAGHAFNFAKSQQSEKSWGDLLKWLDLHIAT